MKNIGSLYLYSISRNLSFTLLQMFLRYTFLYLAEIVAVHVFNIAGDIILNIILIILTYTISTYLLNFFHKSKACFKKKPLSHYAISIYTNIRPTLLEILLRYTFLYSVRLFSVNNFSTVRMLFCMHFDIKW